MNSSGTDIASSRKGRLEVYVESSTPNVSGTWEAVCADRFGGEDGQVACKEMCKYELIVISIVEYEWYIVN